MGAAKFGRLSSSYCMAAPMATTPPLEKPRMPIRSGAIAHSAARRRTTLIACCPSAIASGSICCISPLKLMRSVNRSCNCVMRWCVFPHTYEAGCDHRRDQDEKEFPSYHAAHNRSLPFFVILPSALALGSKECEMMNGVPAHRWRSSDQHLHQAGS